MQVLQLQAIPTSPIPCNSCQLFLSLIKALYDEPNEEPVRLFIQTH